MEEPEPAPAAITVELFGLPRLLAGAGRIALPWREGLTLADLPPRLAEACPALRGKVVDDAGRLVPGHVFNLNGRDFVRDPAQPVHPGDCVLLLSADPGG
jgi:hypothetical protein